MPDVEISSEQQQQSTLTPRPVPGTEEYRASLQQDPFRNWGEIASGRAPGRSAKKRQQQVQVLIRRMQAETRKAPDGRIEGPLRPCTVVNFNPIELVVEGQLRITVPKPGTTQHHQVKMPYRGRTVPGHYCYIASPMVGERKPDKQPIFYTVTTGHEVDSYLPIDVPTVAARVFSPHSIACELWSQYNSPSHKLMGGILIFDQGPHTLAAANMAKTANRIWVPERRQFEDEGQYTYELRETTLDEELDRIFEVQRNYCDLIVQTAHTLWAEQDVNSRKMVTDTHREWARFAVMMGYLSGLPEWVNAKLILGGDITDLRVCRYCGTQQVSAHVYFCPKCNAPYDPYQAFVDGLFVPQGYLETLSGAELDMVVKIQRERRERFAGTVPEPEPPPPLATGGAPVTQSAAEAAAAGLTGTTKPGRKPPAPKPAKPEEEES